jgi:large subunit ribosomal protein L1
VVLKAVSLIVNVQKQLREAINEALNNSPKRKFEESVELIVTFPGLDVKKADVKLREVLFLPHAPKKKSKICIVAEGDLALQAKDMEGFHRVLSKAELEELGKSKKMVKKLAKDCDWVLVQSDLMGLAGRILGPALGPRGKIPIAVPPRADLKQFLDRYNRAVIVRIKDQPQVQTKIGTVNNTIDELVENAMAVLNLIDSKLRGVVKIGDIYIKKTMGKPVKIKL